MLDAHAARRREFVHQLQRMLSGQLEVEPGSDDVFVHDLLALFQREAAVDASFDHAVDELIDHERAGRGKTRPGVEQFLLHIHVLPDAGCDLLQGLFIFLAAGVVDAERGVAVLRSRERVGHHAGVFSLAHHLFQRRDELGADDGYGQQVFLFLRLFDPANLGQILGTYSQQQDVRIRQTGCGIFAGDDAVGLDHVLHAGF